MPRGFGALLFLVLLLLVLLVPRLFVLGLVRALVVEDVQEGQVFGHFFTAEFLVFLVVFVCCWWCGVRCGCVSLLALVVPRLSSLSWPELELALEDDEGDGGLLVFALCLASVVGGGAALLFQVVERVLAASGVCVASRRGLGFGVPPISLGASPPPVFGSVFSGTAVEVVLARAGRVVLVCLFLLW